MYRQTIEGKKKVAEEGKRYRARNKERIAEYRAGYKRLNRDRLREQDRDRVNAKRDAERERLRAMPHDTRTFKQKGRWLWECTCGKAASGLGQKSEAKAQHYADLHLWYLRQL